MSKAAKPERDSRNWYRDRYQSVLLQRRLFVGIAFACLACAIIATITLGTMTPLKSVEPFVIQVDTKSGITQVVDPLSQGEITGLETVNNFFIVQYIRAREGYNVRDISRNYAIVRVMSDPKNVYPKYTKDASPSNPQSNAARLVSTGTRVVKFRSIVPLQPGVVQARIVIEEISGRGTATQYFRVVTMSFGYEKLALTDEERYINPLGFRVTDYRIDEEVVQQQ